MPDLRPYQRRGIAHLERHKHSLLLLPMGAGKTAICCRWIGRWNMKVLIVAPLRVAETVWGPELELWAPGITYRVVTGAKAKRERALSQPADVTIVNYENLVWFLTTQKLDYDTIIFDELTGMKNHSSKRFKTFIKYRKKFETTVGLTGTFTSNGIKDVYAQARCIDGGHRLGRTLTAFRAAFMLPGYMHYDWSPRPFALKTITRRLSDIAFTVTDEEYKSQLPPLIQNSIEVELPPDVRAMYNDLVRDFIVDLPDDITVMTPTEAAKINKLQQLADGFAYYENGEKSKWIHNTKLDALGEILESQQGAPTIVVYKYRAELEAMRKRYPGTVMNEHPAQQVVDMWNGGAIPVLYGHPRSMGHGLNLQHGGNTVVWYGFTWSMEEHDQVNARLLRSGQTKPVFAHYIKTIKTVDEDLGDTLQGKIEIGDTFMAMLKRMQETT